MSTKLSKTLRAAYDTRTAGKADPPSLDIQWGYAEVAAYLGVSEGTVNTYRKRAVANADAPKRGDLPTPDRWTGNNRGPLWNPDTIIRWDLRDRPGQGVGGGRPWHKQAGSDPGQGA